MNALVQYQVTDMERMARAIAGSKLFGVQNPEQALALCLVAQAEGRHPATAAQDYHILQGRPAKKADAMLRDFLAGGGKVEWHSLSDTIADATFTHPAGGSARIDWTLERAKRAGLTTPMWSKYPRQMLRARCVSEGVRTVFPMATSGMYVPEEVAEFEPVTAAPERPAETRPALPAPADAPGSQQPPAATASPATQQYDEDRAKPKTDARGVRRVSSAEAKRLGLDKQIGDAIWGCTTGEELAAWNAEFDKHTAQVPVGWLDSIRNDVVLRAEAIAAENEPEPGADMDEAYRATVAA